MINVRVVAVAPGIVKTPIWDDYKRGWVDEGLDKWVTTTQVAQVMLDLVQKKEYVGGTIVEVGWDHNRLVERLNDPGSNHTVRCVPILASYSRRINCSRLTLLFSEENILIWV